MRRVRPVRARRPRAGPLSLAAPRARAEILDRRSGTERVPPREGRRGAAAENEPAPGCGSLPRTTTGRGIASCPAAQSSVGRLCTSPLPAARASWPLKRLETPTRSLSNASKWSSVAHWAESFQGAQRTQKTRTTERTASILRCSCRAS
eukprot:scaffold1534_cov391-Prasinococcus_capsulatus_cf.AAC.2